MLNESKATPIIAKFDTGTRTKPFERRALVGMGYATWATGGPLGAVILTDAGRQILSRIRREG